jgi:hypothetical protein
MGTLQVEGGSDPCADGPSWLHSTEEEIERAGSPASCSNGAAQTTVHRHVIMFENVQNRCGIEDFKF